MLRFTSHFIRRWCCFTWLISLPLSLWAVPIPSPFPGHFYHGCYPGGQTGEEDDLTEKDTSDYEKIVGLKAEWIYFSQNWYRDRTFPFQTAQWIRTHGAVPFIRLMLRNKDHHEGKPERKFSLQAILDGNFDADFKLWGEKAAAFHSPLIVEYGTEVNGDWFGWNGKYHGGKMEDGYGDPKKADGPERFVAAYRHIIDIVKKTGAHNITWVFHVDCTDSPDEKWNRFENYYPGDDWIDWIGVSCYGPQNPLDQKEEAVSFQEKFDPVYLRIEKMAPAKPVVIAEFGCTAGNPHQDPAVWAAKAFDPILTGRWKNVIGFSWWNERWENDDNPLHNTTMRVQDIPGLRDIFQGKLKEYRQRLSSIPLPP